MLLVLQDSLVNPILTLITAILSNQPEMKKENGKAVLLKHLSDITVKGKCIQQRSKWLEVVHLLQEKQKTSVHLLRDENGECQANCLPRGFQDDHI